MAIIILMKNKQKWSKETDKQSKKSDKFSKNDLLRIMINANIIIIIIIIIANVFWCMIKFAETNEKDKID